MATMSKEERAIRSEVERQGLVLLDLTHAKCRHHCIRVRTQAGTEHTVFYSCTSSDWRAWEKLRTKLRHVARGIPLPFERGTR